MNNNKKRNRDEQQQKGTNPGFIVSGAHDNDQTRTG